jgi:hypothetical protein
MPSLRIVGLFIDGLTAIFVGDYNAVGPIKLAGFKDVGPRQSTHSPNDIISLRLDCCMARGLRCSYARVLARGSSDHHPILLKRHILPVVQASDGLITAHIRRPMLRVSVESWLRVVREAPARIRVRQTFLEALDLKLRKAKRAKAKRQRPNPARNDIMAGLHIEDRARSPREIEGNARGA